MKVEILDDKVFASLDTNIIERYLRTHGWTTKEVSAEGFSIWESKLKKKFARVWLPIDKDFLDFNEGIGRLVKDVASFEDRSQLELFEDLNTVAVGDVVRLTTYDRRNRESTTIPISEGLTLVEKAKRMATAAALSTESRQAIFSPYRPTEVAEYLASVRLGQTEKGSYKIKIISPLPIQAQLPHIEDVPFERRVITTLMESLDALKTVSKDAQKKGRYQFEAFREIVSHGVSANLCEALTESDKNRYQQPIDVQVTWSTAITAPTSSIKHVDFDANVLYFVEKAGRDFREHHPERIILRGIVTTLKKVPKKKGRIPKSIVVVGIVDDRFHTVHIDLDDPVLYDTAIDAHREEKEITFSGIIRRKGTYFSLDQPEVLTI